MDKGYHAAMRVPAKLAKICRTPADCPLEPAYAFAAGVDEGRAAATRPACILKKNHTLEALTTFFLLISLPWPWPEISS